MIYTHSKEYQSLFIGLSEENWIRDLAIAMRTLTIERCSKSVCKSDVHILMLWPFSSKLWSFRGISWRSSWKIIVAATWYLLWPSSCPKSPVATPDKEKTNFKIKTCFRSMLLLFKHLGSEVRSAAFVPLLQISNWKSHANCGVRSLDCPTYNQFHMRQLWSGHAVPVILVTACVCRSVTCETKTANIDAVLLTKIWCVDVFLPVTTWC